MLYDFIKLDACAGAAYTPREDSFLLADAVKRHAFKKTLDIGTGSGIQGLVAASNGCDVTFLDIDPNALDCARRNASMNSLGGRFVLSDLFSNIGGEKFNTIIFNPPYLHSKPLAGMQDPVRALDGGEGGREVIDRFLEAYGGHVLEDHVVIMLESSLNGYESDVKKLNAEVVAKERYFFEEVAVLLFS
ncbi:methyltransferase [Candidatus Marsarchaeota archaeon]|nr:methyltransferase [Candidatus Marsarchaeota archaeon]